MKVLGWILLVMGILSFIGALSAGHNPTGSLFWGLVGAYLVSRANNRIKEQEEKEKWNNN